MPVVRLANNHARAHGDLIEVEVELAYAVFDTILNVCCGRGRDQGRLLDLVRRYLAPRSLVKGSGLKTYPLAVWLDLKRVSRCKLVSRTSNQAQPPSNTEAELGGYEQHQEHPAVAKQSLAVC